LPDIIYLRYLLLAVPDAFQGGPRNPKAGQICVPGRGEFARIGRCIKRRPDESTKARNKYSGY